MKGRGRIVPYGDCIGTLLPFAADLAAVARNGVNAFMLRALDWSKTLPACAAFGAERSVLIEPIDGEVLAGREIQRAFAV